MTTVVSRMNSAQVDAVFEYAKALYEGRAELPDGLELGEDIEKTIENMLMMKATLRVQDYNSVDAVYRKIGVIHPYFMEAALNYQPTSRTVH